MKNICFLIATILITASCSQIDANQTHTYQTTLTSTSASIKMEEKNESIMKNTQTSPMQTPQEPTKNEPVIIDVSPGTEPDYPDGKNQANQPPVFVDSIQVSIMESFPVQVSVTISGSLPDSCTSITDITTSLDEGVNTFSIQINTSRPEGAMCAEVLMPFEETIMLETASLEAGTYTVEINGITDTFTLETDNKLP